MVVTLLIVKVIPDFVHG